MITHCKAIGLRFYRADGKPVTGLDLMVDLRRMLKRAFGIGHSEFDRLPVVKAGENQVTIARIEELFTLPAVAVTCVYDHQQRRVEMHGYVPDACRPKQHRTAKR